MDLSEYSNTIVGVPHGVLYGQFERVDEINQRMMDRQTPDYALAPNFDPRPVMTKYSVFPMLNSRMKPTVPIQSNFDYSVETNFTPPLMARGPVSGFINNVEVETTLRNQRVSLQKGADQGVYIPSSTSDLYNVSVVSRPAEQPYPLLFQAPTFDHSTNPNLISAPQIGRDFFHNNTRTQLRNTIIQ